MKTCYLSSNENALLLRLTLLPSQQTIIDLIKEFVPFSRDSVLEITM